MGTTASQQRGIMAELVEVILKKYESIDKKVAWMLARTRVWIRIRWLNRRLTEEAAERRARQQVLSINCSYFGFRSSPWYRAKYARFRLRGKHFICA